MVQLRSFARLDMEALIEDASTTDWEPTLPALTVDEALNSLKSLNFSTITCQFDLFI